MYDGQAQATMELRCPSCGKAMWAPETGARPIEREIAKQDAGEQPSLHCSTCDTSMPFQTSASGSEVGMDRWLPDEPAKVPVSGDRVESVKDDKPFPSRLAEPLPEPGYPDQVETRARFTAEIQARHARILAHRPIPELLTETPVHLAQRPSGHRDPLGSSEDGKTPTLMEAAEQTHSFAPPGLGTPETRNKQAEAQR